MQAINRYSNSERSHQQLTGNFSPKPYRKHEPPEAQEPTTKTSDQYKREAELIDLTKASKDGDLYSADIDFMNNYLKSLPDYSKMNQEPQSPYSPSPAVRLREHPTPKPFYSTASDYNSRNSHKSSVPQSPKSQRKQINPLSKSNSIHSFSKRNIGQSIEKETPVDEQKSKISRSTSSTTIPVKESSDLMGFMRKPSSLMNIFKKFGSQHAPTSQPKASINGNNNSNANNATSGSVRKNVHDMSKTPSVSRTKNISDFWNENLQQQNTANSKLGWNYHKIMPPSSPLSAHKPFQPPPEAPKQPQPQPQPQPSLVVVKKLDQSEPSKPLMISNLSKKIPSETALHHHHHTHSQHYPKSHSISHFTKKLTESPKLQRSARALNDLDQEHKLLKSSSNSHIYMNQDDPNYFKNLHKITKSLDNATNNIIGGNKSSYKRSISNTSVPCFLGTSPQQGHMFFAPPNQPPMMMIHPSSAPISFYPPIAYKPPQDYHQRSGSKSNIPLCYKYPLNKSSSNASMMSAMGFYVQDPVLWQAAQQQQQPPLHHINKSSSSSCIYAKTLSQPTHLSKNNDIFAKYKPIVSDDEESESEDDDTSKHSNLSKSSFTSVNKVPAPAPFKKQPAQTLANNYPPFTKINSIQIPINGQLPSAFKSGNNSADDQSLADVYGSASRKNSLVASANNNNIISASKPLPMTSPATAMKNSFNQANGNGNNSASSQCNIFYNFLNPMAATQASQSIGQMHSQQQNESVGCYTPYTKYLSDRKYFDVAMSDGMNVSGAKPEQRRASRIPTLSEPQKAKPALAEPKATTKPCEEETKSAVEPKETAIVVDPNEILSAFDPYFIANPEPEPSTSNKLHQLLATVASEWNSCEAAPAAMMGTCKAYQGDRYGSSQYEVERVLLLARSHTQLPALRINSQPNYSLFSLTLTAASFAFVLF